jgi:hypothetical protein
MEYDGYVRGTIIALTAAVGVMVMSACSDSSKGGEPPVPEFIVGHGEGRFPTATLTDWASLAEQLSAVTIVSEAEIPPPASVLERREGYIGRRVTARIDQSVWVRINAAEQTGTMEWNAAGWIFKGERKIPFYLERSPRLEVGGRYIGPFLHYMGNWGPLGTETLFPAWDDVIATADVHVVGQTPLAAGLTGKSAEELRRQMELAAPRP